MRVLGIETSCDETGVAVFEEGRGVLAERLCEPGRDPRARSAASCPSWPRGTTSPSCCRWSRRWSRPPSLELSDLDAIAYTAGPGLIGALLVGGALASSLAYGLKMPALPVHHLEGHLLASMLEPEPPEFPFLALLVSGGHTQLIEVAALGATRSSARRSTTRRARRSTRSRRLLGPAVSGRSGARAPRRARAIPNVRIAAPADERRARFQLQRAQDRGAARDRRRARTQGRARSDDSRRHRGVVPGGRGRHARGQVPSGARSDRPRAARDRRRRRSERAAAGEPRDAREAIGVRVYYPRPALCTDNGAMIAYAGWCRRTQPASDLAAADHRAKPRWPLNELGPAEPRGIERTNMDKLFLRELRVEAIIGFWEWERRVKQTVSIDLEIATDARAAARVDAVDAALNYEKLAASRRRGSSADRSSISSRRLAECIARDRRSTEFGAPWVKVAVTKPGAIRAARDVGVLIERRTEDYG